MSGTLDKTIARAEGFLKRFRDKPVAHLIDGKQDGGSGATFETLSPIDNSVIAEGRARWRGGDRPRRQGCDESVPHRLVAHHRRRAPQAPAQNRRRDRGARRRDRARRVDRYRAADPLHVEGGRARRGELPLLCGPRAGRERRPVAADRHAFELHDPPADRPRGRHHALEYAVHALDLEDRARARGRLHGRAQARRVEPPHRGSSVRNLPRSGSAAGRAQHCARLRRGRRPRAHRASRTSRRSASSARARPARPSWRRAQRP